jgi:hypothetical protein
MTASDFVRFTTKENDELKTIAENKSALFSDSAVGAARMELISRGLKEIEGHWAVDATTQSILDLRAEIKQLRLDMPQTMLVSHSFWARAIAVVGHSWSVQIGIAILVFIVMLFNKR